MRIKELDYLKGVMIILVITFHLVYFEHLYPYAKQVVYTFHMPVFLLISGYLMNISKKWSTFLLTIVGLVIPYLVMESGYTVMASLLPINEHIDHLTVGVFFDKLLLHPLGPYWYLHTLILCGLTYRLINRTIPMILVFYLFSHVLGILSFPLAMYFLIGAVLRLGRLVIVEAVHVVAVLLLGLLRSAGGVLVLHVVHVAVLRDADLVTAHGERRLRTRKDAR